MGGKVWSREEEECFWTAIVPQSPKAVNAVDRVHEWETCAQIMQQMMGDKARRQYTKLMLFEHYFQNVKTGHRSPFARGFVAQHQRQLQTDRHYNEAGSAATSHWTKEIMTASGAPSNARITRSQPTKQASQQDARQQFAETEDGAKLSREQSEQPVDDPLLPFTYNNPFSGNPYQTECIAPQGRRPLQLYDEQIPNLQEHWESQLWQPPPHRHLPNDQPQNQHWLSLNAPGQMSIAYVLEPTNGVFSAIDHEMVGPLPSESVIDGTSSLPDPFASTIPGAVAYAPIESRNYDMADENIGFKQQQSREAPPSTSRHPSTPVSGLLALSGARSQNPGSWLEGKAAEYSSPEN